MADPIVAQKKKLKKKAQKACPGDVLRWVGGVLYNFGPDGRRDRPMQVGGVPEMYSGIAAKGLRGGLPDSRGTAPTTGGQSRFVQPREDKPSKTKIFFRDLLMAEDALGLCGHCYESPNPTVTVMTADMGLCRVVKCKDCGAHLQPYVSRLSSGRGFF